jgi:hypothetical protein
MSRDTCQLCRATSQSSPRCARPKVRAHASGRAAQSEDRALAGQVGCHLEEAPERVSMSLDAEVRGGRRRLRTGRLEKELEAVLAEG